MAMLAFTPSRQRVRAEVRPTALHSVALSRASFLSYWLVTHALAGRRHQPTLRSAPVELGHERRAGHRRRCRRSRSRLVRARQLHEAPCDREIQRPRTSFGIEGSALDRPAAMTVSVPSVDDSFGLKLLPALLSMVAGSADVISFLGLRALSSLTSLAI